MCCEKAYNGVSVVVRCHNSGSGVVCSFVGVSYFAFVVSSPRNRSISDREIRMWRNLRQQLSCLRCMARRIDVCETPSSAAVSATLKASRSVTGCDNISPIDMCAERR
jgi:hypothetical protein